jgi:hypothetical protein
MLREARLVALRREAAEEFLTEFEHLGNVGLGVWHWGLEVDGSLASVVSYGTPCFWRRRGLVARIAREASCGIVQLCRGGTAPWARTNTASRLICLANRQLYALKGPLLVVAYADEEYGEVGTIYQACNALYLGLTDPKGQADYVIKGKRMSAWVVRKRFGTRDRRNLRRIDPSVRILPLRRKHRYLLVAGSSRFRHKVGELLESHLWAYPKRFPVPAASR